MHLLGLFVLVLAFLGLRVDGRVKKARDAVQRHRVTKRDASWVTRYRRGTAPAAAASSSDGSCNDLITCADSSCNGPGDDPFKNPKCENGCPCIYLVVPTQGSASYRQEDTLETMAANVLQVELKASYGMPTNAPSSSWGALPTLPTITN